MGSEGIDEGEWKSFYPGADKVSESGIVGWSKDRTSVTKKCKELYKNWINDSDPKNLKKKKGDTFYRKLTAACQTKAKRKERTGIIGITSTIGSEIA